MCVLHRSLGQIYFPAASIRLFYTLLRNSFGSLLCLGLDDAVARALALTLPNNESTPYSPDRRTGRRAQGVSLDPAHHYDHP